MINKFYDPKEEYTCKALQNRFIFAILSRKIENKLSEVSIGENFLYINRFFWFHFF